MLKKTKVILLLLACALTGCTASDSSGYPSHDWVDYFVYPPEEVYSFDVDENGLVYCVQFSSDVLKVYSTDGTAEKEITLPTSHHVAVKAVGETLYTLSSNALYRNDDKLYSLDFGCNAKDLAVTGDSIFILCTDFNADFSNAPVPDILEGWNGEKVIEYSIAENSASVVNCDFPLLISEYENKLWIYGVRDEGYYVCSYENGELSEPKYSDAGMINAFQVVDDSGSFIYPGYSEDSTPTLILVNNKTNSKNDIMTNAYVMGGSEMAFCDGYFYFLDSYYYSANMGKVERINLGRYAKSNTTIKLLSVDGFFYTPFGCGRTITTTPLSKDEFCLSVLSQDTDYDACVFSSSQDISQNLYKNGSYYSLNEVAEVAEYIEQCFPSIKETVINEDGDIWALPLNLNTYCAIYNEQNCAEAGIDISDMKLTDMIIQSASLDKSSPRSDICIPSEKAIRMLFRDYLTGRATDLSCKDFSEKMSFTSEWLCGGLFSPDRYITANNTAYQSFGDDMLIMLTDNKQLQLDFSVNGSVHAADIFSGSNPADCVLLCINPASANLEATLEYVSALSRYLSGKNDGFLLENKTLYSDSAFISELYDIYSNSEVSFRIPDELLINNIIDYRDGKKTLDEVISDSQRKLVIYINE